jgi:hypothetical protein
MTLTILNFGSVVIGGRVASEDDCERAGKSQITESPYAY